MSAPAFRDIPYMGVIQVVAEAAKLGFSNGHADWCNLGQGQPEVGRIADLPAPFNDAEVFFRRALEARVMVVPGAYFDVNPGKARPSPSPYAQWLRFSFGPPKENVVLGLQRLKTMIAGA
jgi:DNA-binding transcriptional MocR family regulator